MWKWIIAASIGLLLCLAQAGASSKAQSAVCTHFVDNQVSFDGDGSEAHPWDNIAEHVDDLSPGDVMCIRGNVDGSGRVYDTRNIELTQNGTVDKPITIRSYPEEKVIVKNVNNNGLLGFNGVEYWIIESLIFDNNNKWARTILLQEGSNHNILRNNEIRNGLSDGITLNRESRDNIIENNYIHGFLNPDLSLDAHCILIHVGSDNTLIHRNTFHDCSGNGVQLIRDDTGSSEAARNVQITENVFRRGAFERIQAAIGVKAGINLRVANNVMYGYYDHNAINHGGTSTGTVFENNVIFDSARGFRIEGQSEGMIVRNNMIYDVTDYAIQIHGVKDGTFAHNTIVNAEQYAFRVVLSGLDGGRIQNNLFVNSGKAELKDDVPFSNVIVGYNGWFDTDADVVFTDATDTVGNGDPGFVDAAHDDYRLDIHSVARDAGIDVGVEKDFEGDPRPFGARPDLGADEYTPFLELGAIPLNKAIHLVWTEFDNPDLYSYIITYSYESGGQDADQGPSPLSDIVPATTGYSLTGLKNYVFYTITVTAVDENDKVLDVSNTVKVMPTDIFVYLPLILKEY